MRDFPVNRLTVYLKNKLKEKDFRTTYSFKNVTKEEVRKLLSESYNKNILRHEIRVLS